MGVSFYLEGSLHIELDGKYFYLPIILDLSVR